MLRKIHLFFVVCTLAVIGAQAQSDISQATNWYNRSSYNPATITRDDYLYLFSNIRKQWSGIEGAPTTMNVQASEYFFDIHSALGASLICDKIGATQVVNPMLTYAYRIDYGREEFFSMGLSAGAIARSVDGSVFEAETVSDPSISYTVERYFSPDANLGFEYQTEHFIYSLALTHLFSLFNDNTAFLYSNHRYLSVVYKDRSKQLLNYHLELQLINRQNYLVAEANASVRIKHQTGLISGPREVIELGMTYRTSRQLIFLLGINVVPNLKIGYAYTQSFITSYYGNMTNEIMIEYRIPKKASFAHQYRDRGFWYN